MSNQQQEDQPLPRKKIAYLDSESDTDSDSDSDSESGPSKSTSNEFSYKRPSDYLAPKPDLEESPEQRNIRLFQEALKSRRYTRLTEEDEILARTTELEKLYNFPKDNENWREEDLKELWADAPTRMLKPGWDPALVDEEDWKIVRDEVKAGRDPPIAPFYLPYRKPYPAIPSNHYDISNPRDVIEELDRTEEFMQWVSYVFPDGGSYEGTVWDDMAHGKGVYVAQQGLVRYEGEWLQNNQEGHGVVEVEIPDIEPVPGSKLEAQMRAEGKIFRRDFMTPEDREWLEMDIEDSVRLANGNYEIPFYEQEEWIRQYGKKPEKGRYRYAGQWKHGRMHGCGVYEVNERPIFGRFYFGEHVEDSAGCDEEISAMHAGIAEVAAAKARMFVNKPDGMVREERGPYGDPQHPYFYEANEVWQAPGFINQFYEVPEYWKTYVDEVDQEREMWLNSFYKAPLRLPMPAELEYWWEKDAPPEFILLNKEPEPDPNDPTKLIYTEDPLILHTPSGRIIDYVEDEEHGVRLFWRSKGDTDPSKVEFLPLGFDEFFGRKKADEQQEGFLKRLVCSIENFCKPWFEKLEKWTEEQKTASEIRKKLLEQELELVEAELSLEEALEDMEESLKQQEEAADNLDMDIEDEAVSVSPSLPVEQVEEISPEQIKDEGGKAEEEDDDDDDDDDDLASSSFGSVSDSKDKKNEPGRSAFSTLSFASPGLLSAVPSILKKSFSDWKKERSPPRVPHESCSRTRSNAKRTYLITFHHSFPEKASLRVKAECDMKIRVKQDRKSFAASQTLPSQLKYSKNNHQGRRSWIKWSCTPPERISDEILSLHIPLESLDSRIRSCNIDQSIAICNHFVVNSKVSVCHL